MTNRRGEILVENIIFIVLNVVFITLLILFLLRQGQGAVLLEQSYAKQIALLIDSAKPPMEIKLNMDEAFDLAKENNVDPVKMVEIKENRVRIKLSQRGGYEYSFFNDVQVKSFPERNSENEYTGNYVLTVNEK